MNCEVVSDPTVICHEVNSFFSSIGRELDSNLTASHVSPMHYLHGNYPSMTLTLTTSDEITNVIKQQKNSCPCHDNIHVKILKLASTVISPVLLRIINHSFQIGIFPDTLKIAKLIPIFKAGDRLQTSNYRPISILSTISKLIGKLMFDRLSFFITENNVLSSNQFGFRKKNLSPQAAIVK